MTADNRKKYSQRHGGPYDRGAADSYYGRGFRPHYFNGGTYQSEEVIPEKDSLEWNAYEAGFSDNEEEGNFKDWG